MDSLKKIQTALVGKTIKSVAIRGEQCMQLITESGEEIRIEAIPISVRDAQLDVEVERG